MSLARCSFSFILVAAVVATWAGCGGQTGAEKSKAAPSGDAQKTPAGTSPMADAQSAAPEGLAELGPEDRAAAEKQRICPVSGGLLGSMGKPYKITVKGETVFLCCSGCEEEIQKDPDKYLAKLKTSEKK
jgi:hypothetical protein